MSFKPIEPFIDREVSRKPHKNIYGDINIWYNNCTLKPTSWLMVYVLAYLFYCQVNLLGNPKNIELLEKANDNWLAFSNTTFELKDINKVINVLEQHGLIINLDGYKLKSSKPVPILTAVKSVINIMTTQHIKF